MIDIRDIDEKKAYGREDIEHNTKIHGKMKNLVKHHNRKWGYELEIVNNEMYCGKLLVFRKNEPCSWHYHKLKDVTLWLYSGKLRVCFGEEDDMTDAMIIDMEPGDSFHIYPGLRYQMMGVEESKLFEFSTQHFESDMYRIPVEV